MTVVIVDLGCANIASVVFALERFGVKPQVTHSPAVIAAADHIILPGVGAAAYAMGRIQALGLTDCLRNGTQPLLGICLGMQILFELSEEGDVDCLGIVPGTVRKLPQTTDNTWPHMGWNKLSIRSSKTRLLDGIEGGAYVYFAHGYACPKGDETVATSFHGKPFAAVIERGRLFGCQFHPERSGAVGARILSNFLDA